ncbi:MAG: HAD-IA family hydrolase [Phycisphaerales bacterium]|nr:HAD-IA family hydrolase [Phycisphaerales bacterium]
MKSERIVCFDLGGVIVRICRSWEEGCRRAGVEVRDHERFMHEDRRAARENHTDRHQRGHLAIEDYCAAIAHASDAIYEPYEVERVHRAWLIDEYHGVADLIDQLNSTPDIRTACLSNTNEAHWNQMLGDDPRGPIIPALAKITHRVASHHAQMLKPNEDFYRHFEQSLAAPPESIIFFDDLEENIAAARSIGWTAHQIDHTRDTAAQMRYHLTRWGLNL